MQERLKKEEFQRLYVSIIKDEAALHQVFEEKKAMLKKLLRGKKSFPKTYVLAALLVLSFGIIHLLNQRVVYDETKQTWYFSGSSINSEESTSYTLFDGSKLSFKGPSSVIFQDKNNIQINRGLLDAKIVPRKNDKLNFLTPSGKFTVLGTQFSLWVQKSTSLLKVSEGKVGIQDKVISTNQKALIEKRRKFID